MSIQAINTLKIITAEEPVWKQERIQATLEKAGVKTEDDVLNYNFNKIL